MLVITMRCDRPDCGGTVEFTPGRPGGGRHDLGRCDGCGAMFRLYGGQVAPVVAVGSTARDRTVVR